MSLADPFPDVETALYQGLRVVGLMSPQGGPVSTGPSFLPSHESAMGTTGAHVRVIYLAGPDDKITSTGLVDIDVFAARRGVGYAVAEQVRGIMNSARSLGGIVIDQSTTVSGPKQVPWDDNENIRRFLATYRVSTRRQ